MTTQPMLLLDFPDEILFLIAEYLESSRKDLCAFACACVRLSEVADPCCYRSVLIRSEDQVESLSNAVQRKPQRCSFIRQLVLVPAIEHATNIMDGLHFVLDLMHLVQALTVELPFYNSSSTAVKLKLKYRDGFGDIFEAASLVSCVAKPRAFQGLRSCKLNFQEEWGKPWSLGIHSMVFLHDTLESLTLVATVIDGQDVKRLRHHRRLTRLSRLHFDQCGISSAALETILSVPRALQSLELTEYDYGMTLRHSINDLEELKMALSPQEDSLRDLHLGLLFQRQGFLAPYDLSSFTTLQKLTLECAQLNGVLHSSLTLQDGMIKISEVAAVGTRPIVWISLPERPFSLELQTAPGHILTDGDVRTGIERLGRSLRTPHETMVPQSPQVFETRLVVVRQTEPKGAVPPYLYGEHIPEKVVCYDSFGAAPNWDFMTDAELQTDDNVRRLRGETPFPDTADGGPGDFLLDQLNSA